MQFNAVVRKWRACCPLQDESNGCLSICLVLPHQPAALVPCRGLSFVNLSICHPRDVNSAQIWCFLLQSSTAVLRNRVPCFDKWDFEKSWSFNRTQFLEGIEFEICRWKWLSDLCIEVVGWMRLLRFGLNCYLRVWGHLRYNRLQGRLYFRYED